MPRKGFADVLEKPKDPTKKLSAEEKIGRTVQKLPESDRRSLAEQIRQREEEILAKKDLNPDADVSEMTREIEHKKMILQHDEDLTPKSDNQRDRLAARNARCGRNRGRSKPNRPSGTTLNFKISMIRYAANGRTSRTNSTRMIPTPKAWN